MSTLSPPLIPAKAGTQSFPEGTDLSEPQALQKSLGPRVRGDERIEKTDLEVVTFGCRLNAYESEAILARAQADGLSDAVIFNTCAVTAEAVRQARQAIRKARRERPQARLIVTGCAAEIDPAGFAGMVEVDHVGGNALT